MSIGRLGVEVFSERGEVVLLALSELDGIVLRIKSSEFSVI